MKNSGTHTPYTAVERNNQRVLIRNSEIKLPEDAPVRVASAQLEELDYRKLYAAYSSRGRKSVTDPRVIFKVMAYGYQCGIFPAESRKKPANIEWISCGFWKIRRHRIMLPCRGQKAALPQEIHTDAGRDSGHPGLVSL